MVNTQVLVIGSSKGVSKRRPRIRLSGFWLNAIGFEYGSLVTAEYQSGSIVLKLQGSGIDTYNSVVKNARKNKAGLFQVSHEYKNKKLTPLIDIKGFWVEDLGFEIGGIVIVQSEYGLIHIRALDLEKLGFDSKRATTVPR